MLNIARSHIFALKGQCYGEDLTPQQERAVVRGTRGALLECQQELWEELGNLDVTGVIMWVPSFLTPECRYEEDQGAVASVAKGPHRMVPLDCEGFQLRGLGALHIPCIQVWSCQWLGKRWAMVAGRDTTGYLALLLLALVGQRKTTALGYCVKVVDTSSSKCWLRLTWMLLKDWFPIVWYNLIYNLIQRYIVELVQHNWVIINENT